MTAAIWYPAPALLTLLADVNRAYPHRDKASDGLLGDAAHAARVSDHNPDRTSLPPGVVRAVDIDSGPDGDPAHDLVADVLRATIGDPRCWYVISDRRIYSRTHGWEPRVYTGADPHTGHVHVSLRGADGISATQAHDLAFDTSPWFKPTKPVETMPAVSLARVVASARKPRQQVYPVNVRRVQKALNAHGAHLLTTGVYDAPTRRAVKAWQTRLGYTGADADGILGLDSATRLLAGRFRLVP